MKLYYHPFASFCQKALIAFYENDVAFEGEIVDLGDAEQRAAFARVWPIAKFPVLVDEAAGLTIPESTTIIEYVDQRRRGAVALIPADSGAALQARLWDRFFDNYVQVPMQRIVAESFRSQSDPLGVTEAKALLAKAYGVAETQLAGRQWATGDAFTIADCAAAPALFYANIVAPFGEHRNLADYYQRLLARPSFARVVDEARPYRHLYPLEWPASYA